MERILVFFGSVFAQTAVNSNYEQTEKGHRNRLRTIRAQQGVLRIAILGDRREIPKNGEKVWFAYVQERSRGSWRFGARHK